MAYKDLTAKQKFDSAEKAAEEPWHPGTEIRKLVREKLGMDNENMAKGIELKLGPASKDKPTNLNPEVKKKGGMVKKMAKGGSASSRADGIAQRGKTKGKYL